MKFLSLAALALTFAACSSDDNELTQQPAEQPANNNMITITAKLAPKSGSAQTRAVSDDGTNIVVDWAANEHIAILYTVGSQKLLADAEITNVDASGVATISFAVDGSTTDGTACQIVYPLSSAKADNSGVKAYADMLATQDGVLDGDLDVRIGAGTIQTSPASLDVTTQPEAQFAIFKFTAQDLSGSAITYSKGLTEFKVSDATGNVITTVTPTTNALYVGLPALAAGTYWFNATASGKPYIAKATLSTPTSAGNYYQSTMNMATIGNVIGANGKFYADKDAAKSASSTACAVIAYLGSETAETGYTHGLAIAMKDANNGSSTMWMWNSSVPHYSAVNPNQYEDIADALAAKESGSSLSSSKNNSTYPAFQAALANSIATEDGISAEAPATGTSGWFLPSIFQWNQIVNGLTGTTTAFTTSTNDNLNYSAVNPTITAAGGDGLQSSSSSYWSSTECNSDYAWWYDALYGKAKCNDFRKGTYNFVRAAFAF